MSQQNINRPEVAIPLFIVGLVCLIVFKGCGSSSEKKEPSAKSSTVAQAKILQELKQDGKTIKDAVWASDLTLKVGVIDDGSNRDGFAQYVCEVVSANGPAGAGVSVHVIDIVKLVRTDKWVDIGYADCK